MGGLAFTSDIGQGGAIALLLIGGLFTSVQVLTFVVAMEVCPRNLRATAAAACNAIAMLTAAAIQMVIGSVLQGSVSESLTSGQTILQAATVDDFRTAYMVIPGLFIIAFVMLVFLPETGGDTSADDETKTTATLPSH
jgi:hypothetical protein